MLITLTNTVVSFPTFWVPKSGPNGGAEAFSGSFLLEKDDPQLLTQVTRAITEVAQARWPDMDKRTNRPMWELLLQEFKATDRLCLHNGDLKRYEGYEGRMYISARSPRKPLVVNRDPILRNEDGSPLLNAQGEPLPNLVSAESGIIYAGCKVNVGLDIWAQDNSYGKRISAGLRWVQFVADGDAFAAAPPAKLSEVVDLSQTVNGASAPQAAAQTAPAAVVQAAPKTFDPRSLL
jgi:Protein of unknown function (DUF2815)